MVLVALERIETLLKDVDESQRLMEKSLHRIDQRGEEQFKRGIMLDQKWGSLIDSAAALIPSALTYLYQNVKVHVAEVPREDPK